MEDIIFINSKINDNNKEAFIILQSSMNEIKKVDFISLIKEELAYQGISIFDLSISVGIDNQRMSEILGRRLRVRFTDWEIHKIKTKLGI
jgi:hypothetical protein